MNRGLVRTARRCLAVALGVGAITAVLVLLGFGVAMLRLGSVAAVLAWAGGSSVIVLAEPVVLDGVAPGTEVSAGLTVRNVSGRPVRVLGGTCDCLCAVLHDLPVLLDPKECRDLRITVMTPRQPGARFHHKICLYLSSPGPPLLTYCSGVVADANNSGEGSDGP